MIARKIKYFVILILFVIFASCSGNRGGAADYYTIFFVGNGTNQYFIKPLEMENLDGEILLIDFTFRVNDVEKTAEPGTVNFTLETEKYRINLIDKIEFITDNKKSSQNSISRLYAEPKGDGSLHIRMTSEFDFLSIKDFFTSKSLRIILHHSKGKSEFESDSKVDDIRDKLNYDIFELLDV